MTELIPDGGEDRGRVGDHPEKFWVIGGGLGCPLNLPARQVGGDDTGYPRVVLVNDAEAPIPLLGLRASYPR
jgi:hypothetical protein